MLLRIAILSTTVALCAAQACYWPDGSQADGVYKPCANNSNICCYNLDANHHDLCYSNGFCMSLYWGFLYRGACADSTWGANSGCASACKAAAPNDGPKAVECGGFMCCNNNSTNNVAGCCSSKTNTFSWNNATIMPRADLAGSLATITLTQTATLVSSAGGTSLVAPVTSAAVYSSSTPSATSAPSCSSHEVAIGAGLGVPLGISLLALAFLGGLLIRKRQSVAMGSNTMTNAPTSQYRPTHEAMSSVPVYEAKSRCTPLHTSEMGHGRDSNRYHGASELATQR